LLTKPFLHRFSPRLQRYLIYLSNWVMFVKYNPALSFLGKDHHLPRNLVIVHAPTLQDVNGFSIETYEDEKSWSK
jgi:hypothetical protein